MIQCFSLKLLKGLCLKETGAIDLYLHNTFLSFICSLCSSAITLSEGWACPNCFFGHPDHVFLVKYRSEIEISEPFLYLEFISMFVFIDEIRVWNMQVNGIWSILCVIGKWEWFRSVVLCWRDNRVCGFIQGRCHCVNLDCSYSRQVSIVIMVFDALSLPNSRLLKHSCWEIWI